MEKNTTHTCRRRAGLLAIRYLAKPGSTILSRVYLPQPENMRNYPLLCVLLLSCAPLWMNAQRSYTATGPSPCSKSPSATTIQPGDAVYVKGWSGDYERMI